MSGLWVLGERHIRWFFSCLFLLLASGRMRITPWQAKKGQSSLIAYPFPFFLWTGTVPHRGRKLVFLHQWIIWPIRNNASDAPTDRALGVCAETVLAAPPPAASLGFWATGKWWAWVHPQFSEQPGSLQNRLWFVKSLLFTPFKDFPASLLNS